MHIHTLLPIIASMAILAGCSTMRRGCLAFPEDARMTLVYLETGPTSTTNSPEQKQEIFRGHMANMQRLAAERTLLIAGPFGQPRDPAWRGIFIFDVPEIAEAEALGATDPGVAAGEFKLRIRPIAAPAALRETLRLEEEMKAERENSPAAEPPPGGLPPGLRRYVMLHADDFARACRALSAADSPRVIWWARFRDDAGGVLVLDATDVAQAVEACRGLDLGPHGMDRWLSSESLERLPRR